MASLQFKNQVKPKVGAGRNDIHLKIERGLWHRIYSLHALTLLSLPNDADTTIPRDHNVGNTIPIVSGVVAVPVSGAATFPALSDEPGRETQVQQEDHTSSVDSRSSCVSAGKATFIALVLMFVLVGGGGGAYLCLSGRCNFGSTPVVVNERSIVPCNGTEEIVNGDTLEQDLTENTDVGLTPCHGHSSGRETTVAGKWLSFVAGAGSNTSVNVCSFPDRAAASVWIGCDRCATVIQEALDRTEVPSVGLSIYCQTVVLETVHSQTYSVLLYGSNVGVATLTIAETPASSPASSRDNETWARIQRAMNSFVWRN